MNTLSVKELEQLLKSQPFNFISLVDDTGATVVAFNNPKAKLEQRKKEIVDKLKSSILPDGIYYLMFKDNIRNEGLKKYAVAKGKVKAGEQNGESKPESVKNNVPVREVVMAETENVLSYREVLALQQRIATLEAQNLALTKENQSLSEELAELDEMEEQLDEVQETHNSFSFMEKILDRAVPVVEKFFDQKEREIVAINELSAKVSTKGGSSAPSSFVPKQNTSVTPSTNIQPQPQQTIIYPYSGGGGGGTTTTPPPEPEVDQATIDLLKVMTVEGLKETYDGLKKSGNLPELKKFVIALKMFRPNDLLEIIKDDL